MYILTLKNKISSRTRFGSVKDRLTGGVSLLYATNDHKGQARAAVNLQRDWQNGQDPESLPFARSIKTLALVKLVHKGLLYYDAEQAIRQKHVSLRISFL